MTSPTRRTSGSGVTPVPLACLQCRRRHLKCDARKPVCSRCSALDSACDWIGSRRGLRDTNRSRRRAPPVQSRDPALSDLGSQINVRGPRVVDPLPSTNSDILPGGTAPANPAACGPGSHTASLPDVSTTVTVGGNTGQSNQYLDEQLSGDTTDRINEHLLDHYYTSFHPLHPFLAPRAVQDFDHASQPLRLAVQLLGSLYCSTTSSDQWRNACQSQLFCTGDRTSDTVQANLLLCIAFHAFDEHDAARRCLSEAIASATSLGLHQSQHAVSRDQCPPAVQESLRRTWWELLTVDAMMAARDGQRLITEDLIDPSMPLPVDDVSFADNAGGSACASQTLQAFRTRMFAENTVSYSSYAYRIEAVMALRQVLTIAGRCDATSDEVQSINILLASWSHHLPHSQRDLIDVQDRVDHLLLQAHQIVHWGSMLLHFPRSNLLSKLPVQREGNSCMQGSFNRVPLASAHHHAVGAVKASKSITDTAAFRLAPEEYSPMTICCFAFAAMVQIAAGFDHGTTCQQQHERRISLLLGLLKSLGPNLALATHAEQQVRRAAAGLFRPSSDTELTVDQFDELAILSGWAFDFNRDIWL